jgi:hypothetical protein
MGAEIFPVFVNAPGAGKTDVVVHDRCQLLLEISLVPVIIGVEECDVDTLTHRET